MCKSKKIPIIILFILLSSCSAKHSDSSSEGKKALDAKIQDKLMSPEEIFFDDVSSLVLKRNCVSCHDSSELRGGVDLSSYSATLGIKSKKSVTPFSPNQSTMYETLLLNSGSRKMPPINKPQLSKGQIDLIFQWINNGAKNKGDSVPTRPKTLNEQLDPYFKNPETIDYKLVNEQVFKKNCLDCHSDSGSKSDQDGAILYGQDMTNYEAVFSDNGIVPDKLTDYVVSVDGVLQKKKGSRIYKSIALNQTMPPTIDGYLPVDSLYIKLVRLWILNCAIEDYEAIKDSDDLIEQDEDELSSKVRRCKK